MILSAHNLSIGYTAQNGATTTVLRDFSFDFAKGQMVMILGASGLGKSSLLRCLANLQMPLSGSLNMADTTQTAFVFQSPALLPWLTVKDNVAFGLNFKQQRAPNTLSIDDILCEVGLSDCTDKYPSELSGGMASRVALARALVRCPNLIFLDEPFTALDAFTKNSMQRLLKRLVKTHSTAAVMVTHDIDEALLLADRIVLLGQGRLIDEWQLDDSFNRQSDDSDYQRIRREILDALSMAQESRQQMDAEELVA